MASRLGISLDGFLLLVKVLNLESQLNCAGAQMLSSWSLHWRRSWISSPDVEFLVLAFEEVLGLNLLAAEP
eukprot:6467220-Amphidinium_carterae.1